jgi:Cof subfamily protein (haloacid dehalogenase superfamily)
VTYKLLAVDLDGTLLRRDGSIHEDDLAAIDRLRAAGVPSTIVTGRLYSGSRPAAEAAGIRGPIGCVDGSHVVDAGDHRHLVYRSLAGPDAVAVRSVLARHQATSFLFTHDRIVHDAGGADYAAYVRTWSPNIDVVARVVDHPFWEHEQGVMAVVAVGPEPIIGAATRALREELAGAAFVISFPVLRLAGTFAMIVRAAGPTKGTAIEWIAAHYGCAPSEVVAVGDWLNDVPMFRAVGRSFAMGQAPDEVKAAATDQLEAHVRTGGGVAEAVRQAWGIR